MIWDAYQNAQTTSAVQQTETKLDPYADDLTKVRRHTERLALACQAMWEIVRETSNLTELDIENKMLEIDARDGQIDGKMGVKTKICEACGKPTNSSRTHCLMCGAPLEREHQFEI